MSPEARQGPVAGLDADVSLEGAWFQRDGVAWVLACMPLVLGAWAYGATAVLHDPRVGVPSAVATLLLVLGGVLLRTRPLIGRIAIALGVLALLALLAPVLLESPAATLAGVTGAGFLLFQSFRHRPLTPRTVPLPASIRAAHRSRAAGRIALLVLLVVAAFHREDDPLVEAGTVLCCFVAGMLALSWTLRCERRGMRAGLVWTALAAAAALLVLGSWDSGAWLVAGALCCIAALVVGPLERRLVDTHPVWDPLLSHPARHLIATFLALSVLGTLFLALPWATPHAGGLETVDAAFTAVSAVCVTGLVVVDTVHDFTPLGQIGILILIQVGGLGIMTLTTVALHVLGRRLSLRHESALAAMGTESRDRLVRSLRRVVLLTFGAEALGALLLYVLFASGGEPAVSALYRAVFTAVSAFCNAGFALQTDSLVGYQAQPLVLHVVGALIVIGGLSPAVALSVPGLLRGRRANTAVYLVLAVTVALLLSGWLLYGLFEWHASLQDLSTGDRIHNAWFQSVTLRTAGFNSVQMEATRPETRMMMMAFMFVGGSPGGTAGGIKTTTFAVLLLAVFAAVSGRDRVVFRGRHIGQGTVARALAVLGTGVLVWSAAVLGLLLTQAIPARDVVFEATSAMGTVGLSTGATAHLDGTGKIIVMIAMFLGRVGPLTLFTLLGERRPRRNVRYPEATVPIA